MCARTNSARPSKRRLVLHTSSMRCALFFQKKEDNNLDFIWNKMATRIIYTADITAGMELTEFVKNLYGQMLLPSGTILTENHISLFKTWGIQAVVINSDEPEVPADLTSALDFETMTILKKRMNWTPMNDQEMDLFNLAVQTISKQK